jgi:hypothetical protein
MAKRIQVWAAGVLACLAGAALPLIHAADPPAKGPEFRHGLELRVRTADEADFKDTTKKVGVEFFQDEGGAGNGVYIDDTGDIATAPKGQFDKDAEKVKAPEWRHGMKLRARKAGDKDFTSTTKQFGVEVFRDETNGNYVYICETGSTSVVPGKVGKDRDTTKPIVAPTWKNGMELRIRKAGEADFNDKTMKIGVEVFLDENNGNFIYISEKGNIAVLPPPAKLDPSKKAPDWKHGMELAARKADEKEFSATTRKYGVEVFSDEGVGAVLYVADTGAIAAVPAGQVEKLPKAGDKVVAPDWKRAMVLACRKAGEADFSKTTKRFGVEVFLDPNTGNAVHISETGSLAVVGGKS